MSWMKWSHEAATTSAGLYLKCNASSVSWRYFLPTALLSHFHLKTRALDISRFFESSIIGCQTCKFAVKSSRCFYPPLFNLSLLLPISSIHCLLPSVFNFRSHDLSIPIILDQPCLPHLLSHTRMLIAQVSHLFVSGRSSKVHSPDSNLI